LGKTFYAVPASNYSEPFVFGSNETMQKMKQKLLRFGAKENPIFHLFRFEAKQWKSKARQSERSEKSKAKRNESEKLREETIQYHFAGGRAVARCGSDYGSDVQYRKVSKLLCLFSSLQKLLKCRRKNSTDH
jgi:hypothetical protein